MVDVNAALRKKKAMTEDEKEKQIEAIAKERAHLPSSAPQQPTAEAPPPASEPQPRSWARKSLAIDNDLIEALEQQAARERKFFSALVREFLIDGLKSRGVSLPEPAPRQRKQKQKSNGPAEAPAQ